MTAPVIGVEIGGRDFRYWEQLEIRQSMDNFSTIDLSAPFEPLNADFQELFKPFSFQPIRITVAKDDYRITNGSHVYPPCPSHGSRRRLTFAGGVS